MNASKVYWCNNGFWRQIFGFCPSERAWNNLARTSKRELGPYPPNEDMGAATTTLFRDCKFGRRVAVVTIANRAPDVTANLLVHEAVHVWQDLCESIGELAPSSEFEAYTVQHMTAELFRAYEKTRGPLFTRPSPSKPRKRPAGPESGR